MDSSEERDVFYMRKALELAKCAYDAGDTPIGAVLVYEDRIIGSGYTKRNALKSPLMHAEIEAIREGADVIGDWRLEDTTMYITLEPCPMCAGAIVQARIPRVVIGAMNPKAGCAGSVINLLQMQGFNHRAELVKGVLEEESAELLRSFFGRLRDQERAARLEQAAVAKPELAAAAEQKRMEQDRINGPVQDGAGISEGTDKIE